MFSITTIESSTTRPIAIVSAPSVRMFSEYPKAWIPMKVMRTLVGIEIAVTSVERTDSRKIRITITAKTRPSSPSWASDSIDCWMNGAWSNTVVNVAPGRSFLSCGIRSVTAFDTSTVFADGSLVTAIVRAVLPSTRESDVTGSPSISTFATDPTVAPGVVPPMSGIACTCSTLVSFSPVCTVSVLSFSVMDPPGNSVPFCCSASLIALEGSPAASSAVLSGVIVRRLPCPPTREAAFTPLSRSIFGMTVFVRRCCAVSASENPVTASWITGKSSIDAVMTWGSTPSGSCDLMRPIAWLIFCSAVARLVPYAKDAWITDELVVLVAVDVSRPGTPWIAVSIGVDTSCSTTSGEAPG